MLLVYEELKNDFMKPIVSAADELFAHGVSVTVYQGHVSRTYHYLCSF